MKKLARLLCTTYPLAAFPLLAALLLSCQRVDSEASAGGKPPTRSVRDGMGRLVQVPLRPRRIVSLTPSLTETLYAVGAGDLVVGRTDFCSHPPEACRKPSVGGVVNPSLERIVSLRPDLVLASTDANRIETAQGLAKLGIPAYAIRTASLEGVLQSVHQIGELTGNGDQARLLAEKLQNRLQTVQRTVAGRRRPRVLFLLWQHPIISSGRGSFVEDLLEKAGADSITSGLPQDWPRISLEEVVLTDPEFLIIPRGQGFEPNLAHFERPGWRAITAVRKRQVVVVEDAATHPSPRVFDALEKISRALYPPREEGNRIGNRP